MQAFVQCKHFKQCLEQINIQGSTSDAKSCRCAKPCPVRNHAPLLYMINALSCFLYLDREICSGEEIDVTDTTEEENYLTSQ